MLLNLCRPPCQDMSQCLHEACDSCTARAVLGIAMPAAGASACVHEAYRLSGVCLSPSGSASCLRAHHAVCAPRPQWARVCLSPSRPCGCVCAGTTQCAGRNAGSSGASSPPLARHWNCVAHDWKCWWQGWVLRFIPLRRERRRVPAACLRSPCFCGHATCTVQSPVARV